MTVEVIVAAVCVCVSVAESLRQALCDGVSCTCNCFIALHYAFYASVPPSAHSAPVETMACLEGLHMNTFRPTGLQLWLPAKESNLLSDARATISHKTVAEVVICISVMEGWRGGGAKGPSCIMEGQFGINAQ